MHIKDKNGTSLVLIIITSNDIFGDSINFCKKEQNTTTLNEKRDRRIIKKAVLERV
jgi:hypothetical protein